MTKPRAVSGCHTGLPHGPVSAEHRPEVFPWVACLRSTPGSFCPRLCWSRGAAVLGPGVPGADAAVRETHVAGHGRDPDLTRATFLLAARVFTPTRLGLKWLCPLPHLSPVPPQALTLDLGALPPQARWRRARMCGTF